LSCETVQAAITTAAEVQLRFYRQLWDEAEAQLAALEQTNDTGILLAGHPYHNDSGISHGIDVLLNSLGLPVFSCLSLSRLISRTAAPSDTRREDSIATQWQRTDELAAAAGFVAAHPNLEFVQLHSFGCGIDALALEQIRGILERAGKLYTLLKVDEMVDIAAVRIRLRSLLAALRARKFAPSKDSAIAKSQLHLPESVRKQHCEAADKTLAASNADVENTLVSLASLSPDYCYILPALIPEFSEAVAKKLSACSCWFQQLPALNDEDMLYGQIHCNNDICYQLIGIAGQVLRWVDGLSQEKTSQDNKSQDKKSQGKKSQDNKSQDKKSQDNESQDNKSRRKTSQEKQSDLAGYRLLLPEVCML
jgi:hypothetical protein